MFAVVSLVEIVAGVAGVAFEARKGGPFVFKDSLEDSLCAFVVLGLAAAYARRRERLVASAAVSGLAVGYALAKSVVVALTEGRPDTVSIGLTVACCGGGVGAFLVAAKEDRARLAAKRAGGDSELTTEYAKLEDGEPKAKPDESSLSMRAILRLLKPYFWPRNWAGRVAVISTLLFVTLSKVCSVVAPLVLATAANAVASETVDVRKAVYMSLAYAGLTFTGKVMKECQSLAYLRVQKYAFTEPKYWKVALRNLWSSCRMSIVKLFVITSGLWCTCSQHMIPVIRTCSSARLRKSNLTGRQNGSKDWLQPIHGRKEKISRLNGLIVWSKPLIHPQE